MVMDRFRSSLTDPERIKKATKAYHGEYEKTAKKNNAEKIAAIKQLNKVKVQIDRIVTTIIDTGASKAMSAKLKDAETERAQLEERVRLLTADNVVTMHPNVIKRYVESIDKLHQALSSGEDIEAKAAFRNVIDSIIVHPTPKRAAYEVTPMAASRRSWASICSQPGEPTQKSLRQKDILVPKTATLKSPCPRNRRGPACDGGRRGFRRREWDWSRAPSIAQRNRFAQNRVLCKRAPTTAPAQPLASPARFPAARRGGRARCCSRGRRRRRHRN